MTQQLKRIVLATLAVGLASATLVAAGPRHRRPDPIMRTAYDLEATTHDLYRFAARRAHPRWFHERIALRELRSLERQARDFRINLRRHGVYSYRVERDIREVRDAYRDARRAVRALRPSRHVDRAFRQVSLLMRDLDRQYRMRVSYHRAPDRRYGHRWDDEYDDRPRRLHGHGRP
jgi:hypothetical protein